MINSDQIDEIDRMLCRPLQPLSTSLTILPHTSSIITTLWCFLRLWTAKWNPSVTTIKLPKLCPPTSFFCFLSSLWINTSWFATIHSQIWPGSKIDHLTCRPRQNEYPIKWIERIEKIDTVHNKSQGITDPITINWSSRNCSHQFLWLSSSFRSVFTTWKFLERAKFLKP